MEDLVAVATRRPATQWVGHPIVLRDTTGSTNDDVRDAANGGAAAGYTVVANAQTSGRGRRGRTWLSPAGENLYVSVLLRPRCRPDEAPVIALAAGLAVRDALVHFVEPVERTTIKWPNDVRIDGRKVSGVLVEGSIRGSALAFAVVGIGINVRGVSMPDEIASRATSVRLACGEDLARGDVLEALLTALENRIEQFSREGAIAIVRDFSARCDTLGTDVSIDEIAGRAESISVDGGLVVLKRDGARVEVRSGEIR